MAVASGVRSARQCTRRISLACALVAVLAGLAAIWASHVAWPDASELVKVAASDPIAPLALAHDPGFGLVGGQEHYDGVYYYAIALDPLALGQAHGLIDQAGYRYGRPMHGWLASALSLGNPASVPEALLLLSLIGLGAGAYLASRLCVVFGRTPWGGLAIAMSPGLLFAATVSVTETMGAAVTIGIVLAWMRRAPAWLIAILAVLLCLYREQLVLVLLGIAGFELVDHLRDRRRLQRVDGLRLLALAAGPVALVGWLAYVHTRFGSMPAPADPGNVDLPLMGWLEAFRWATWLQHAGSLDQQQMGSTAPPMLIAIAVVLLAALWAARNLRSPLDGVLVMQVVLMAVLSWRTLVFPHELYRIPALSLLIALGVLLLGAPARAGGTLSHRGDSQPGPGPGPDRGTGVDGSRGEHGDQHAPDSPAGAEPAGGAGR
ncbi:MAG: hypothetical protein KGP12_02635 [Actinomycetales bacterium]|nr:hypothetical protein [Actinomycetales bacterium]